MELNDFLDSVGPTLAPDLPSELQQELRNGRPPETFEEEVWLEWHSHFTR